MKRAQCQWSAASPPPHHLGRHQLLVFGAFRVGLQIAAKLSHALVQLAKDNVCSIAAQDFRHCFLSATQLVRITKDEVTSLQWLFLRITSRNATPFDGRVADAVPESKRLCFC